MVITMPVAAPVSWRAAILGAPRGVRVLGAMPAAVYLRPATVSGEDPAGGVLAVLTSDAVRLPFGAVVAVGDEHSPWARGLRVPAAVVGDGRIRLRTRLDDLDLVAARWLAPPRPRPPRDVAALTEGVSRLATLLPDPPVRLPAATPDGEAGRAAQPARLVGLGPGLTPYADDVLAGHLLAWSAWGSAIGVDVDADAVLAGITARTTAVSAACLHSAASGEGAPEVVALVNAVGGHGDLAKTLTATLRLGHTSGHGLAAGVLTAGRLAVRCTGFRDSSTAGTPRPGMPDTAPPSLSTPPVRKDCT